MEGPAAQIESDVTPAHESATVPHAGHAPAPAAGDVPGAARLFRDVWSHTDPRYRLRAIALLLFNLLLYSGLCVFAYWLRTAELFDFSLSSFVGPARFWGANAPSLNDYLLAPISLEQVPEHAVVLGLVLGAVVAVPLVISILYRFPFSLLFVFAVLVFAHMPWLALTLLSSCVIASLPPFRLSFRFGSALVGLLPVALYLLLATRGSTEAMGEDASPLERSLFAAPWVLTLLSASAMLGIILLIARLVNYRPGAVAPVVMIMFAAPVITFHMRIGVHEVAYRALEAEYGPQSSRFQSLQSPRETEERILRLIASALRNTAPGRTRSGLQAVWSEQPERIRELKRDVQRWFLAELLSDRAAAQRACQKLRADFPESRYRPNVLYIEAHALDTRLDERRLQTELRFELYDDFPHAQSEPTWRELAEQFPDSPLACVADLRLGQLAMRAGDFSAAQRWFREASRARPVADGAQSRPSADFLRRKPAESSLRVEVEPYQREARRLLELLLANGRDPRFGDEPLQALASLDPRRERYGEQLLRLLQTYRDSALHDNLLVLWVSCEPDLVRRASLFEALLGALPESDAKPEALYHLADLEIQALASIQPEARPRGRARLESLAREYADSFWGRRALERIRAMEPDVNAEMVRH